MSRFVVSVAVTRGVLVAGAVAAACVLAACGGGSGSKGATQVAAKVNKEEISVHQVEYLLRRQGNVPAAKVTMMAGRSLEMLIDQELMIQEAEEAKLDRDPGVVMAIEAAKREIVARAYVDKMVAGTAVPTDAEIQKYYDSKPNLFAKRKVFTLSQVAVPLPSTDAKRAALEKAMAGARSADEVTALLKAADVKFGARRSMTPAENVPMGLLDKLASMSVGQSLLNSGPDGLEWLSIDSTETVPVTLDKASAAIKVFMVNDAKRRAVAEQIKQLRAKAKIEYEGQFKAGAAAAAAAPTAEETVPQVTAPSASESPVVVPPASTDSDAFKKGISGLK